MKKVLENPTIPDGLSYAQTKSQILLCWKNPLIKYNGKSINKYKNIVCIIFNDYLGGGFRRKSTSEKET